MLLLKIHTYIKNILMNQKKQDDFESSSLPEIDQVFYRKLFLISLLSAFFISPLLSFSPILYAWSNLLQKIALIFTILFGLIYLFAIIQEFMELEKNDSRFTYEIPEEENDTQDESTENLRKIVIKEVTSRMRDSRFDKPDIEIEKVKPRQKITLDILKEMDWKIFEDLCAAYFEAIGYKSVLTGLGEDGGIDIKLINREDNQTVALVQCKRWTNKVKLTDLRQFLGVMSLQKVDKGFFVTSSTFNIKANKEMLGSGLTLIDGAEFIKRLSELDDETHEQLYKLATHGNYKIPTCVKCGAKMQLRTNKKTGEDFWGCPKGCWGSNLTFKSSK